MEKADGRKVSAGVLEEKRKVAMKLRRQGMRYGEIAEMVEVHEKTVGSWCRAYKKQGATALKAKRRGRVHGSGRFLTQSQEALIQRMICDKTPDQLKLRFALWTRMAVQQIIQQECGVKVAVRTVGEYLKRWGFTPQKPLRNAYEQKPEAVDLWLKKDYPDIVVRAKKENAEIHWGDETGVRSDSQHGRGYAPKGKTPVIRISARRTSLNMLSAITNQGKVRFKVFDGNMNSEVLIDFMKRLIKDAARKVYLILDNLKVHHAKVVRRWLDEHPDEIEVFYLPAYSPELNPDEYLNCDLKAGVHSRPPARTNKDLKDKVVSHMRMLQKKPNRVQSYFRHPKINYAA